MRCALLLHFPLIELGDLLVDSMNKMEKENVGWLDLSIPNGEGSVIPIGEPDLLKGSL